MSGFLVTDSSLPFSDVTINDASTLKHGFLPKLSGNPTDILTGTGAWASNASDFIPGRTVVNYSALPAAALYPGMLALVLNNQGVWLINFYSKGIYYSDGVNWNYEGDYTVTDTADHIISTPSGFITAVDVQTALNQISDYFTPLVWTSGADLSLGIGQSAKITVTNATSIPLHIACGDGQIYEMHLDGTYTSATAAADSILEPNNVAHATSFTIYELVGANSTAGAAVAPNVDSGFRLDNNGASIESAVCTLFTSTLRKKVFTRSSNTSSTVAGNNIIHSRWQDTTTVWSSLGTITMPNAWTGEIIARRVA